MLRQELQAAISRGATPDEVDGVRADLAVELLAAGHAEEAIEQLLLTLSSAAPRLGDEADDVLDLTGVLGRALTEAARFDEAEQVLRSVVDARTRTLGPEDPQTLVARGNLLRAIGRGGRPVEALTMADALLEDRVRLLGADHPSTLDTRGHRAQLLSAVGRHTEAIEEMERLLDDRISLLGASHPDVGSTRHNLAAIRSRAEEADPAEVWWELEQNAAAVTEELGSDHPHTLVAWGLVAEQLQRLGRDAEALALLGRLVDARTRVLGADAAATLMSGRMRCTSLRRLGHVREALADAEELEVLATESLGSDSPLVQQVRIERIACLRARIDAGGPVVGLEEQLDALIDQVVERDLDAEGVEALLPTAAEVLQRPSVRHSPEGEDTAPSIRTLSYWDYDPHATVACNCGWSGPGGDHEEHHLDSMLLDVRCGSCGRMLLVAMYPTLEGTRAAAAAGNPRAQAELPDIEGQAAKRAAKAAQPHLTGPDQLPDLPDEVVIIDWTFGGAGQALMHHGTEIWSEPAYYESYRRFAEIFEILREKYGDRFAGLIPEETTGWWLYGDRLGSPGVVSNLNRSVRKPDEVLVAALGAERAAPYLAERPESGAATSAEAPPATENAEPTVEPPRGPEHDVAGPGCEKCVAALNSFGDQHLRRTDVASSFRRKFFYFSAELFGCGDCATTWLRGYYEDDSRNPDAEWGERHFIVNRMTPRQVEAIDSAAGSRSLDIDDFAAEHSAGRTVAPSAPNPDRVVRMRELRREDLWSSLEARYNDDGDLVITGHDIGTFVAAAMRGDEYEYAKTFAKQDFPVLLQALGEEPSSDVLDVIEARWCGDDRSFEFEHRLTAAGVACEFWCWP